MTQQQLTLGVLYPDDAWVDEELDRARAEWRSYLPSSVRMVSAHHPVAMRDVDLKFAIEMAEDSEIEASAIRLVHFVPNVNALAYYCTTMSFVRGIGGDEDIIRRLEKATGLPSTTTSTAVVKALRTLGLKRIAVTSPYLQDVHDALIRFLTASGFDVVNTSALNVPQDQSLVPFARIRAAAEAVDVPEADGVFISCTGMKTAGFLSELERQLGKPLVTANQATAWYALQLLGVKPVLPGMGKLFGD